MLQKDCILYALYIGFYVVFIYFYWKDMPMAFSPLGSLMCPRNKKSLWLPMSCTSNPPTSTPTQNYQASLVISTYGIQSEICSGAFFQKHPTLAVLAEELRRKEILNFPCLLVLLIHTKHKKKKINSWIDPTSSFHLRRTHPLGR